MFPFSFEWHWDIGHIIFFGLFYLALTVVGSTLCLAGYMTYKNLMNPPANSDDHH